MSSEVFRKMSKTTREVESFDLRKITFPLLL